MSRRVSLNIISLLASPSQKYNQYYTPFEIDMINTAYTRTAALF